MKRAGGGDDDVGAGRFAPPQPADGLALRHGVLARLSASAMRVGVITAPAGYGKSSHAAAWVASDGRPVAWIDLEAGHDDALVLLTDLVSAIAAVTLFEGGVVGVLWGLVVAVALSIVHTTSRSARPHDAVLGWVPRLGRYADASTQRSAQITPGVVVYRLDDRLFFANAAYVRARIFEAIDGATTRTGWLVFDAEGVPTLDSTGTEMLEQLIDQLATMDIGLAVARAKGPLLDGLDAAGLTERIGTANLYPNVEAAVATCAARSEPR
jgi:MFS superfamily sulfate permease-like transporter